VCYSFAKKRFKFMRRKNVQEWFCPLLVILSLEELQVNELFLLGKARLGYRVCFEEDD